MKFATLFVTGSLLFFTGCGSDDSSQQPQPQPQPVPTTQPQPGPGPGPNPDPQPGGGNTYGRNCQFTGEHKWGYPLCCEPEGIGYYQDCWIFVDDDCGGGTGTCGNWQSIAR